MSVPKVLIPILVLVFVAGGYALQTAFFFPTTEVSFNCTSDKSVEFVVDGVRCRGTAAYFTEMFARTPGIAKITTYAASHTALFEYDSQQINPDRIKSMFEKEIRMADGSFRSVFTETSRKER
jgi:hypothetical protein